MLEYLRSEDEGVVTEEFSSSRGSSETQGPLAERGKCSLAPCSEPQCQAATKLDTIMKASLHYFSSFISALVFSIWRIWTRR